MNEQVLVIDDEKDAVEGIVDMLLMNNITCRGQTDPREAIRDFASNPSDVVIVDYHFPPSYGITGLDIIEQLRAIKPFTQFILVSGMINRDLDEASLTQELREYLKASAYISKPLTESTKLVGLVKQCLDEISIQSSTWEAIAEHYLTTNRAMC